MYRVPPSACTIAVATGIRREEAPSAVLAREGEKVSGHFQSERTSKCSFVSLIVTAKRCRPNRSAFTPRETIAGRQRVRRESARGPTTAADRRQRTPVGQVSKRTLTTNQSVPGAGVSIASVATRAQAPAASDADALFAYAHCSCRERQSAGRGILPSSSGKHVPRDAGLRDRR